MVTSTMSPTAFLSRDPIGYRGSPYDLYEFLDAKPLALVDPSGEIVPILVGVGVAIGIGLSPNIANAPGPGEGGLPGNFPLGTEPENAVIGAAVGAGVGVAIRCGCAVAATSAASTGIPEGTSYIGWVYGGRIVTQSIPITSHAALGANAGLVANGTAIQGAHAFTVVRECGQWVVLGSQNFGGTYSLPAHVIRTVLAGLP